ncbi:MAG: substrate-binding domain-containing protein [Candidatus Roseilinea sp.]|uniref:substrate-binding domain-containing protein n=1 Tax=Candidatus Roseilinea sp. TaxID=2838777 RepID=UPI00404B9B70
MRACVVLLIVGVLSACVGAPAAPAIRLSQLEPLPTQSARMIPLRVAVAAVISPRGTVESYRPLLDYLSRRLSRPVELVQRRTYAEVNDLLEQGEVDVAFVCTSAYVAGHDQFGMELLAAPQVNGAAVYHSVLVVPAESAARSIADLRGKVFAFTDPMSTSGRMYPTWLVQQLGATPESFFARTFFTYSHDDAIRAVAEGLADGAAVDSLVYDYAIRREPALREKTRLIHRSPSFATPPVVVRPGTRPQLKAELRQALLDLADDPHSAGDAALQAIGVERFILIEDSAYDSVRDIFDSVGWPAP